MVRVNEVREDAATPLAGAGAIRAMPAPLHPDVTSLRDRATALDHLSRVFAIRPRERVLLLVDPLLDPRVVRVIEGIAAARGFAPLLLLDEVAAHLDETRREALFEALATLPAQVFLTGTDAGVFAPLRGIAEAFRAAPGLLVPDTDFPVPEGD